jgi:phosphoenolpyruvate-protein kinase (PTS system EI component)
VVATGPNLIVDAERGRLELEPGAAALAAGERRAHERRSARAAARAAAQRACRSADGARIEVFANVGSTADAESAVANGAEGCGLLRTEFLFLERTAPPDEAEQRASYQAVADALGGRPLVLRLLDVGGDKPLSYLPLPAEDNPALGLRGIRTGLARPDLQATQLRAALAVEPRATLKLLVPMVTEVAELRAVRALIAQAMTSLGRTEPVALGAMIETPAAAVTAAVLAREVDFLSIGSNDLSQYALAMDRGHADLAGRIDALHPAVLRLIGLAAEGGAGARIPVAVCGGMAGDPLAVPLLLGLGVTELSMVPARIPPTKALVARLTLTECRELAREVVELDGAEAVRARVRSWLESRAPAPGAE